MLKYVELDKIEDGKVVFNDKRERQTELKWNIADASKFRFGKYTAKLLLVYDDGKRDVPIEGEVSFWVIPWRAIGIASFFVLLILFGVWSTFRHLFSKVKGGKKDKK